MSESKSPETLTDLLRTLERSRDLRPLARECGLTLRELRKRLARWRRELGAGDGQDQPRPAKSATIRAKKSAFAVLSAAR